MIISPDQDKRLGCLLASAQAGDSSAYGNLLDEISDILRGYLLRRLPETEDAEEVLQETLISIHNARHTYDPTRSFASWMFAICQHRMSDHWRKLSRLAFIESSDELDRLEASILPMGDELTRAQVRVQLQDALRELPLGQRQAVELLKLEGLSIKEAAHKLEISEAAIKVNAHRGYKRLKQVLADLGNT